MAAAASDFHPLSIAHVHHDAGDALVVTFAVPAELQPTFDFKPGQHIALRAVIDGVEIRRNYSICAGPGDPLRIGIKRVADGQFSTWAHAHLAPGQLIDVMPPSGRFVLPPAGAIDRHIVLFAAGSGITPCLGVLRQALSSESGTRVTLVYGNRRRDSAMFIAELEALKDQHLGRLELIPVFSAEGEADVPLLAGRIDGQRVRALASLIDYDKAERLFVCGPGDMIKAVRDTLMELGVPRDRIAHEFFAPPGAAARRPRVAPAVSNAAAAADHDVTVLLDGVRHRIGVAAGETVLDAALAQGLKAPHACRGGMCSTCRAKVVSGSVSMTLNYSLEPWELERGFVLACQAVPGSPTVELDFDAM